MPILKKNEKKKLYSCLTFLIPICTVFNQLEMAQCEMAQLEV